MKKLIEIILDDIKLLIQIVELFTNFSMMRFRSIVQITNMYLSVLNQGTSVSYHSIEYLSTLYLLICVVL